MSAALQLIVQPAPGARGHSLASVSRVPGQPLPAPPASPLELGSEDLVALSTFLSHKGYTLRDLGLSQYGRALDEDEQDDLIEPLISAISAGSQSLVRSLLNGLLAEYKVDYVTLVTGEGWRLTIRRNGNLDISVGIDAQKVVSSLEDYLLDQ